MSEKVPMGNDIKTGKQQKRLFDNPFLESLTKTNPLQSSLVYAPTIAAFLYVGIAVFGLEVQTAIWIFLVGIASWSISEYLLHRYIFHWVSDNKYIYRFHYLVHGVHHEYPHDEERLIMPPVPGLILASVLFCLFYPVFWVAGGGMYAWAFFPGWFLGYLLYTYIHYSIHKYDPPKGLEYLWQHHHLHHFKYPQLAFGVSSWIWDKVFRTMPPNRKKKRKNIEV